MRPAMPASLSAATLATRRLDYVTAQEGPGARPGCAFLARTILAHIVAPPLLAAVSSLTAASPRWCWRAACRFSLGVVPPAAVLGPDDRGRALDQGGRRPWLLFLALASPSPEPI